MNELLQIGAIGAVFYCAIREFFAYLRSRKQAENGQNTGINESMLAELQKLNGNHLHSIESAITTGNDRLIDAIHSDNLKIIELLGEIKGRLAR
jgi:hypothetical protein